MANVFVALQKNEDTRAIVMALERDNPHVKVDDQPAMLKIDAEHSMVFKRITIEEVMGRTFDLQELHMNFITLAGNVDETDDELCISWN